jgi:hypothetical protein
LTAGRSEEYQAFDLEYMTATADVWYSNDGKDWNQRDDLLGDYVDGIGNFDADFPSKRPIAPWYARFGHSMDALDANGDGEDDAIVILGGYVPEPANDIWISMDGKEWVLDGYAPWPKRAWHGTVLFKGSLYVIGGTPLTNDVWAGNLTTSNPEMATATVRDMKMVWWMKKPYMADDTPFSPRSGHCLLTQLRKNNYNDTMDMAYTDRMFLIGGFSSWPLSDDRHDGERARNDIYSSTDGSNWTKLEPPLDEFNQQPLSMPWAARSWLGCATFHQVDDRSIDVNQAAHFAVIKDDFDPNVFLPPKMYIFGGGYMGKKANHVVRKMEAYVDAWWSRDGRDWKPISYKERYGPALYTTQEWAGTTVEDNPINIGKWGFTVLPFFKEEDLDGDGKINEVGLEEEFDFAGNTVEEYAVDSNDNPIVNAEARFWRRITESEKKIPALVFIAGDTVDNGGLVNDVFISQPGLLCEVQGVSCSGRGFCGPGTMGCICESREYIGEYCEKLNDNFVAAAGLLRPLMALQFIAITGGVLLTMWY